LDADIADTLVSISAANGFAFPPEITSLQMKRSYETYLIAVRKVKRAKKTASFISGCHGVGEREESNEGVESKGVR